VGDSTPSANREPGCPNRGIGAQTEGWTRGGVSPTTLLQYYPPPKQTGQRDL